MPTILRTPRVNNNDDRVRLSHIFAPAGTAVKTGDPVAEVETDKASFTVESDRDGFVLAVNGEVGLDLEVGSVLLWIGDSPDETVAREEKAVDANREPTLKALLLLGRYGLDARDVPATGDRLSARDVLDFASSRGTRQARAVSDLPKTEPLPEGVTERALSAERRGMLRTVSWQRDHAVPGYIELRYDPDPWETYAAEMQARHKLLGSPLVSLLAWRLAGIAGRRPLVNSFAMGESVYTSAGVHLGFTMQTAAALFLLVIRNAEQLDDIAFVQQLGALQRRAMKNALAPAQTSGATIGFTSMARWPVTRHIPILPPRTSLMVAHTCPAPGEGILGATYDHRVLTGEDVVETLAELSSPPE